MESLIQLYPGLAYPNPYFRRESFLSLDGEWDFAMDKTPFLPKEYNEKIIVPFAVETPASGIKRHVGKDDRLHYRKVFDLPEHFTNEHTAIKFQAVDQVCDVYLNGAHLGHHEGGYLPFEFTVGQLKREGNVLQVEVSDDTDSPVYPRGKQSNHPGGIWYTPTSGIYGTVYLEDVPSDRIEYFRLNPDFDNRSLLIYVKKHGEGDVRYVIRYQGDRIASGLLNGPIDCSAFFHPWDIDHPNMYEIDLLFGEDKVTSQFGFRKFAPVMRDEHRVFGLNGKPTFLSGVLDQGYWPESGLTCPSLEAAYFDVSIMKKLGFNTLRKHIKVEDMRFYALCDYLGMIVIQDIVNGGAPYKNWLIMSAPFIAYHFDDKKKKKQALFGREAEASRTFFTQSLSGYVDCLYNVTSLAIYTLFNEGWGQFDAAKNTKLLSELDPTRLIDSTSGWFDQGCGDFSSHHVYFKKLKLEPSDRILALTEFGGYSYRVKGHLYINKRNFGYGKVKDGAALTAKIKAIYQEQVLPLLAKGLSVAIYTQLSDVENETNGLLTYDRAVLKVDESTMRQINEALRFSE